MSMYFRKLKNLRIDNDLTQKEISIELGISQQTYSDYEKGKYDIPNEIILKIAEIGKNTPVLMITHNEDDAKKCADNIFLFNECEKQGG